MKYIRHLALGFFLGNISRGIFRSGNKNPIQKSLNSIEVYGHRGEAGHYPENTIPGFLSAIGKGVHAIELDVVISKDKKVVVSHEPFMASHYMLDENGRSIPKKKERSYNLFQMDYDSIRRFDSGSKKNRSFPRQKKITTTKPLLKEVFDTVEKCLFTNGQPLIKYLIEVKSSPRKYGIYQPHPEEFVHLLLEVIAGSKLEQRVILKSFDPQILNTVHASYPGIKTSFLVSRPGLNRNLSLLNFTPTIYSPRHKLIRNRKFVDSVHSKNMKLVPWTVNRSKKIRRMIRLGVDGIISDYPERVFEALQNSKY